MRNCTRVSLGLLLALGGIAAAQTPIPFNRVFAPPTEFGASCTVEDDFGVLEKVKSGQMTAPRPELGPAVDQYFSNPTAQVGIIYLPTVEAAVAEFEAMKRRVKTMTTAEVSSAEGGLEGIGNEVFSMLTLGIATSVYYREANVLVYVQAKPGERLPRAEVIDFAKKYDAYLRKVAGIKGQIASVVWDGTVLGRPAAPVPMAPAGDGGFPGTPERNWTSTDGKVVQGRVTAFEPQKGVLTLVLSNGTQFKDFPLNRLSPEDQAFLRNHAEQGGKKTGEAKHWRTWTLTTKQYPAGFPMRARMLGKEKLRDGRMLIKMQTGDDKVKYYETTWLSDDDNAYAQNVVSGREPVDNGAWLTQSDTQGEPVLIAPPALRPFRDWTSRLGIKKAKLVTLVSTSGKVVAKLQTETGAVETLELNDLSPTGGDLDYIEAVKIGREP